VEVPQLGGAGCGTLLFEALRAHIVKAAFAKRENTPVRILTRSSQIDSLAAERSLLR
jgi:hypothetical protein